MADAPQDGRFRLIAAVTKDDPDKLTFWQMLGSVLAAAFGVQTSRNRERDFKSGKASHFIVLGIIFTVVLVLVLVGVVNLILNNASQGV